MAPAADVPKSPPQQKKPEVHILQGELKRICACESTGSATAEPQHFEADGYTVRYGRINPQDRGICQINAHYHRDTALSLGLDIETEQGNIAYAQYLYRTQGNQPWFWSKGCWGLDK